VGSGTGTGTPSTHIFAGSRSAGPARLGGERGDDGAMLPGRRSVRASYLADIRPLLPPYQRPAMLVADLDLQAVLATGNLLPGPGRPGAPSYWWRPARWSALDQVYRCVSLLGTAEYGGQSGT